MFDDLFGVFSILRERVCAPLRHSNAVPEAASGKCDRIVFEIDGIDPEKLDRLISETPDAKMLYLIPTFQNPAGITTKD